MSKKDPTEERLRASALRRLARRSMSRVQLQAALRRELEGSGDTPIGSPGWVDAVVEDCERLGYLDDEQFAQDQWAALRRRGSSAGKVAAVLGHKGISAALVDRLMALEPPGAELEAARRLVARRRFGHDVLRREQEMASLARAGFAYDVASRAMAIVTEDEEE